MLVYQRVALNQLWQVLPPQSDQRWFEDTKSGLKWIARPLGHCHGISNLTWSHDISCMKRAKKIGCWSLINILSWFLKLSPRKLQNRGSWQSSGSRHTGFHLWDRSSGNWWRFHAQTWFKGKPRTPKEFRDQRIEQTYRNNVCKKIDLYLYNFIYMHVKTLIYGKKKTNPNVSP